MTEVLLLLMSTGLFERPNLRVNSNKQMGKKVVTADRSLLCAPLVYVSSNFHAINKLAPAMPVQLNTLLYL